MDINAPSKAIFGACRTCMVEITDSCEAVQLEPELAQSQPTIRNKLGYCIPELDLNLASGSILCSHCAAAIDYFYTFRQRCLETEKRMIQNCMLRREDASTRSPDWQKANPHLELVDVSLVAFNEDSMVDDCIEIIEKTASNENSLVPIASYNKIPEFDFGYVNEQNNAITTFECSSCVYITEVEDKMLDHLNSHKGAPARSSRNNYITVRIDRRTGLPFKPYKCNSCGLTTKTVSCMNKHLDFHRRINKWPLFKCVHCKFNTFSKLIMTTHVSTHARAGRLECNKCSFFSADMEEFVDHVEGHRNSKVFKCSKCWFIAVSASALKVHSKKGHDSKLKCTVCGRWFVLEKHLKLHQEMHRNNLAGTVGV